MKAKILVVDDDRMITSSLARVLSYEGFVVDVAHDGEEGLVMLAKAKPDLVVLDVSMPGLSGIEICKKMKQRAPATPILFLSAKDEVSDRVRGLESGADDYLVKPFAFEELQARIEVLLRRRIGETPDILEYEDLALDAKAHAVRRGSRTLSLSATEYQLLHCFMSAPFQVLSKEQILDRVWGHGFHADLNLVEVYVRYLRNKMEQDGESRLIQTVRGSGYVLRAEP